MHTLWILATSLVPVCINASTFTVPVQPNTDAIAELVARHDPNNIRSFEEVLDDRKLRRQDQFFLSNNGKYSMKEHHRVELWDAYLPNPYVVPAAVGTPAQPFRLLLDLAWDTLFIPSADCTYGCESSDFLKFFSNQSSSFCMLDPYAEFVYALDRYSGALATDTFRIAGLEVKDQPFVNVNRAVPLGFISFYFGYDGVLGLAPRFNHFHGTGRELTSAPSPWFNMVNHSLLDANLFALELPVGLENYIDINRWGELSFGGISPKYSSANFSSLSLSTYSDQVWAVEAQSLTWHNTTHPIHETFENLTLAGFDTTSWFIGLPGEWARQIYRSVDAQCGGFSLFCEIDCLDRKKMPDFTFGLGGKNFTITAYDYTVELEGPAKTRVCFFDLMPTDGYYPVDAIILGKPFMEAFYSVFDLDEMEVRLTPRIK